MGPDCQIDLCLQLLAGMMHHPGWVFVEDSISCPAAGRVSPESLCPRSSRRSVGRSRHCWFPTSWRGRFRFGSPGWWNRLLRQRFRWNRDCWVDFGEGKEIEPCPSNKTGWNPLPGGGNICARVRPIRRKQRTGYIEGREIRHSRPGQLRSLGVSSDLPGHLPDGEEPHH